MRADILRARPDASRAPRPCALWRSLSRARRQRNLGAGSAVLAAVIAWLVHHSEDRGVAQGSGCAVPVGVRGHGRWRAGRTRRRRPLTRAHAGPRPTPWSTAPAPTSVAHRDVGRPRRDRRPRLRQERRRRGPRVRLAAARRRLRAARPGRRRPGRRLLAAGDRRRPGRAAAGGVRQRRDAVRGPGARSRRAASAPAAAGRRRRQPVAVAVERSARPTWPSPRRRGRAGDDVRAAYYFKGQWALEPTPLDADPARRRRRRDRPPGGGHRRRRRRDRRLGRERPHLHAAGGRARRPARWSSRPIRRTIDGVDEVSAVGPGRRSGGDSTYASVAFQEALATGAATQIPGADEPPARRSGYDGIFGCRRDHCRRRGRRPAATAVTEFGAGWVTSETRPDPQAVRPGWAPTQPAARAARVDSSPNTAPPTPCRRPPGVISTLIAWQQTPGVERPGRDPRPLRARRLSTSAPSRSSPPRRSAPPTPTAGWRRRRRGRRRGDRLGAGHAAPAPDRRRPAVQAPGELRPAVHASGTRPAPTRCWLVDRGRAGACRTTSVEFDGRPVGADLRHAAPHPPLRSPRAGTRGRSPPPTRRG